MQAMNRLRSGRLAVVAGLLVGALAIGSAATSAAAQTASDGGTAPGAEGHSPQYLYVCNQGNATVSIIDIGSLELVETLDLTKFGFDANAKPHHVVVEPDGSYWYVSLIAAGRVLKFTRENELVGQAEFETPGMLALHPTEDILYVGRSMAAVNPPPSIGIIRRSDMTIDELDVFYPRPHAIAVRKQGDFAYSASLAVNQMASIDTKTDAVELTNLEGPTHTLVQFAIAPDGKTMVATAQLTGLLFVFDLKDPAKPVVTDTIPVGKQPWHPSFSPNGDLVYVPVKESNGVTVVYMKERMAMAEVKGRGISQPHGSAVSPDGKWLFVSSNNLEGGYEPEGGLRPDASPPGTIAVIDTEKLTIAKVIEVGPYAVGIGLARKR